jgi:replication-associated recombination protein RarA
MNTKYFEPTTVAEITFGNPESKLLIEEIVNDIEPIPSGGKSGILLWGIAGTGKTTLANLLPEAIELGKTGNTLTLSAEFIGCQQGFTGPQVMKLINDIMALSSLNASGLHYFILDEVDNLTTEAQKSLKTALNAKRAVFILTTNNVRSLDKAMLDRCVLIEMNAASTEQLLETFAIKAANMNVVLNDEELRTAVRACNGSFRNLLHNIPRMFRRAQNH